MASQWTSLSLPVRGLAMSATVASQATCEQRAAEGLPVYRFGLGQSPFPVPDAVVAALREHAARKDYLPVEGLPALRAEVSRYLQRRIGVDYPAKGVLVGPGSKELMFLLQVCYYGELVIPTPAWVSYAPQATLVGRWPTLVPPDRPAAWRTTPELLSATCAADPDRPRLLVLNYPNNPTGGTYDADELAALAEVARRYGVVVLSDEIYGELHFEGKHVSISRFYPEGTIVSTGLSKWCGAGGWRLGCFAFPPALDHLRRAMAAVASETYTSTSAPIQCAAVTAFELGPDIEDYLGRARRVLESLMVTIARRLLACGARLELPTGAFYLYPDFSPLAERLAARGITSGDLLAKRLLAETGVMVLPASAFGRPPTELALRIAAVDFDGGRAIADAGAGPLDEAFLDQHCAHVLEGVDRLIDWVANT